MAKVNGLKVFCVSNCSFRFMLFSLKLYRCLSYGRKMCISFGNTPQIICVTFSQNFGHFPGIITFKVDR